MAQSLWRLQPNVPGFIKLCKLAHLEVCTRALHLTPLLSEKNDGGENEQPPETSLISKRSQVPATSEPTSALKRYDKFEVFPSKPGLSVANPVSYELMRGATILPTVEEPKSALKIVKDEMYLSALGRRHLDIPRQTDVIIVGAGMVGCSAAYFLKKLAGDNLTVILIERDHQYSCASSVLSAGGIRQQFSTPENVQMSLFGAEFLRNAREELHLDGEDVVDPGFHHSGYLTLATEENAEQMQKDHRMQAELGAVNELLSPTQLKRKFPWINTDGVALACHGLENEGWFDPWSVLTALRRKCMLLGAIFLHGRVVGFERCAQKVTGPPGQNIQYSLDQCLVRSSRDEDVYPVRFTTCINAAGPWAGELSALAGVGIGEGVMSVPLPVEPRKRYVYVYKSPDGPGLDCPLVVDPTGAYFRRDGLGSSYICGMSPDEDNEPGVDDMEVDEEFFYEQIWPKLAHRVPSFEQLKLQSSWAGFYDYNYKDQNLILGRHPYLRNMLFGNGSSGHGLQHSLAIGRALAELIVFDDFRSIDLSALSYDRVFTNNLISERGIV